MGKKKFYFIGKIFPFELKDLTFLQPSSKKDSVRSDKRFYVCTDKIRYKAGQLFKSDFNLFRIKRSMIDHLFQGTFIVHTRISIQVIKINQNAAKCVIFIQEILIFFDGEMKIFCDLISSD